MKTRIGDNLHAEEPDNHDHASTEHWLDVYRQLIKMTNRILEDTRGYLDGLPDEARRHVQRTNIAIMEEELEVFHERERVLTQRLQNAG